MSSSAQSLGLDRLTIEERIELVEEIWDGIAASVEASDIPQSHKDLLDRRIASHEADPQAGVSWEELKAQILRTIGESE